MEFLQDIGLFEVSSPEGDDTAMRKLCIVYIKVLGYNGLLLAVTVQQKWISIQVGIY